MKNATKTYFVAIYKPVVSGINYWHDIDISKRGKISISTNLTYPKIFKVSYSFKGRRCPVDPAQR